MARETKVVGITLYPQQLEYLRELNEQGYNRSAVIRLALERFKTTNLAHQNEQEGGQND